MLHPQPHEGYQDQSRLLAMIEGFLPGNLPRSHLQSLCLLADRTVLIGICASEDARGMCLDSAYICIATVSPCPFISSTQAVTLSEHTEISACKFQSPSEPERGFFEWASPYPTLMYHSNYQRCL